MSHIPFGFHQKYLPKVLRVWNRVVPHSIFTSCPARRILRKCPAFSSVCWFLIIILRKRTCVLLLFLRKHFICSFCCIVFHLYSASTDVTSRLTQIQQPLFKSYPMVEKKGVNTVTSRLWRLPIKMWSGVGLGQNCFKNRVTRPFSGFWCSVPDWSCPRKCPRLIARSKQPAYTLQKARRAYSSLLEKLCSNHVHQQRGLCCHTWSRARRYFMRKVIWIWTRAERHYRQISK